MHASYLAQKGDISDSKSHKDNPDEIKECHQTVIGSRYVVKTRFRCRSRVEGKQGKDECSDGRDQVQHIGDEKVDDVAE